MAALAGLMLVVSPALAQEKQTPSIVVTGEAKLSVKPELAYVSLGVVSEAPTAYDALQKNNVSMKSLFTLLNESKVAEKDIQTSGFNISPRYDYKNNETKFLGYTVSNNVTITVRDLANLGKLLDVLVKNGANSIHGVTFGVCDPSKLADDVRKAAMQDAKRKATLYAEGGEFRLGGVIFVTELGVPRASPQMYAASHMADAEAGGNVPVSGGELTAAVRLQVTFAIGGPLLN